MNKLKTFLDTISFDKKLCTNNRKKYIIGIDEVGLGCLAGPIFASAIVLDLNKIKSSRVIYYTLKKERLIFPMDSKKLSEWERNLLLFTMRDCVISSGLGMVIPVEINELDDLTKSREKAWTRALTMLCMSFKDLDKCLILSDAFKINFKGLPNENFIHGDSKSVSIAAASILAKVSRDSFMINLHKIFPVYNWNRNKGYGSIEHIKAIEEKGPTVHHRTTFQPVKDATIKFYEKNGEKNVTQTNNSMR